MLATYVHDMGGGLVMIGGPDAFGAGGWEGSKLEEVLPVNMDIPAQRQMPRARSCWSCTPARCPTATTGASSAPSRPSRPSRARDEIGVISYGWGNGGNSGGGGAQWDFPLAEKGDGSRSTPPIKNMQLGDMPSFDDTLDLALNGVNGGGGLLRSDARQKHIIIISDGDPQPPPADLIDACQGQQDQHLDRHRLPARHVATSGLPPTMEDMAKAARRPAYGPINNNPNQLPQIFIKEATVVRRSLIHEDRSGIPLKVRRRRATT